MSLRALLLLCLAAAVLAEPPQLGPYEVAFADYTVDILEPLNGVVVAYPSNAAANETFTFISFAHGLFGGGVKTEVVHKSLLRSMASHGFIVAATKSCNIGCPGTGFDIYYEEQIKVIVWSQSPAMRADPVMSMVNHPIGYGISGHSMGGQATARSAAWRASSYGIKAAVLLHPFSEVIEPIGKDILIPMAAFTGTEDGCCGESTTRKYYDPSPAPKTFANMVGATHYEPNFFDSRWGVYSAAFFKVWIEGDKGTYYDLMYNQANPDSLCSFYEMEACEHDNM